MKLYEYMVVYSFRGGIGRIRVVTKNPIISYADVEDTDKFVKKETGLDNVFVSDFKLLRECEE